MAFEGDFTAMDVRAMREKLGIGMMQCKFELEKQAARRRIQLIREAGQSDLADVLDFIIGKLHP